MGAEWNEFPEEVQKAIQDQLAVRFGDMTPQGNLFLHHTN
jgi:hypothetical protein